MAQTYPPTVVYSWDYTDSLFDLELRRGKRLSDGWKPEGDPRPVYVMVGNRSVLRHMQTYIRSAHQAVPRPRGAHATAESHATVMAQTRHPYGEGGSRPPQGAGAGGSRS